MDRLPAGGSIYTKRSASTERARQLGKDLLRNDHFGNDQLGKETI
jgi:hypothetical protein